MRHVGSVRLANRVSSIPCNSWLMSDLAVVTPAFRWTIVLHVAFSFIVFDLRLLEIFHAYSYSKSLI